MGKVSLTKETLGVIEMFFILFGAVVTKPCVIGTEGIPSFQMRELRQREVN